jgi:hypothetical protein
MLLVSGLAVSVGLLALFVAALASAAWYWRGRAEAAEAELSHRPACWCVGRPTPPPVRKLDINGRT